MIMAEVRRRKHFKEDDLEDISIEGSPPPDPNAVYEIEDIIFERPVFEEVVDSETGEISEVVIKEYLLKWAGYDVLESTWETADAFDEGREETLFRWQRRSMREARGIVEPFDIAQWQNQVDKIEEEKQLVREKRREKRRRLGLSYELSEDDTAYTASENLSDNVEEEGDEVLDLSGSDDDDFEPAVRSLRSSSPSSSEAEESDDIPLGQTAAIRARALAKKTNIPAHSRDQETGSEPTPKRRKVSPQQAESTQEVDKRKLKTKNKGRAVHSNSRRRELIPDNDQLELISDAGNGKHQDVDDQNVAGTASTANAFGEGLFRNTSHFPAVATSHEIPVATLSESVRKQAIPGGAATNHSIARLEAVSPKSRAGLHNETRSETLNHKGSGASATGSTTITASAVGFEPSTNTGARHVITSAGRPGMGPRSRQTKPSSANVFDPNKPKIRAPRKASTSTVLKPARTLQLQNRLRKSQKQDLARPPPPDALGLARRPGRNDANDSPPPDGIAPLDTNPYAARGMEHRNGARRSSPDHGHHQTLAEPVIAPITTSTDRPTQALTPASEEPSSREEMLLTCWHWHRERTCRDHQKGRCIFEHRYLDHGRIASDENTIRKDQATCFFWWTRHGQCNKSAADCMFSHDRKYYLAPDPSDLKAGFRCLDAFEQQSSRLVHDDHHPHPSQKLDRRLSAWDIAVAEQRRSVFPAEKEPRLQPSEWLGCWYFNFGSRSCIKSDAQCNFLHRRTRFVAGKLGNKEIYQSEGELYWRDHPDPNRITHKCSQPANVMNSSYSTADARSDHGHREPSHPPLRDAKTLTARQRLRWMSGTASKDHISITTDVEVSVQLTSKSDSAGFEQLTEQLKSLPSLDFHMICYIDNAYSWLDADYVNSRLAEGYVKAYSPSTTHIESMKTLIVNLEAFSSAVVATLGNFVLYMYPKDSPWQDLFGDKPRSELANSLNCHVLPSGRQSILQNSSLMGDVITESAPLEGSRAKQALDGKVDVLFRWNKSQIAKVVFLVFHQRYQHEMNEVILVLQQQNVKVYQSTDKGAYDCFSKEELYRQHNSSSDGTVLFHSTFHNFHEFPGLSELTCARARRISFFQLPDLSPESTTSLELSKLFPTGQAVFIMDDCFEENPHDLIGSLGLLVNRLNSPSKTHIVTRPGLEQWLPTLPQTASQEDYIYDQLTTLLTKAGLGSYREHTEPGDPPPIGLYSPNVYDHPEYAAMWDADRNAAADYLVEWYVGWSLTNIKHCRRFALLSSVSSRKRMGWAKKYQHIQFMTPDSWLKQETDRERDSKKK